MVDFFKNNLVVTPVISSTKKDMDLPAEEAEKRASEQSRKLVEALDKIETVSGNLAGKVTDQYGINVTKYTKDVNNPHLTPEQVEQLNASIASKARNITITALIQDKPKITVPFNKKASVIKEALLKDFTGQEEYNLTFEIKSPVTKSSSITIPVTPDNIDRVISAINTATEEGQKLKNNITNFQTLKGEELDNANTKLNLHVKNILNENLRAI